jgi:hypothetical protein
MRGDGAFSVLDSNNFAINPQQNFAKFASRHWLMCWKCQQEKPRKGGAEKMMGGGVTTGLRRFICQECVEAKQKSLQEKT